jgi:nicotinic acid mononucleotide adenylyltransferase
MLRILTVTFAFLFLFQGPDAHALRIEQLIKEGKLQKTLSGKRIGFYPGAYDPLTSGHESIVKEILDKNLCDLVIVDPSWGGDYSIKRRVDIRYRMALLDRVFGEHPQVIVSKMPPQELQKVITRVAKGPHTPITVEYTPRDAVATDGKAPANAEYTWRKVSLKPRFPGSTFIGIIGADTALLMDKQFTEGSKDGKWANRRMHTIFMRGIKIPELFYNHTFGGMMLIPADGFIISARDGADLGSLEQVSTFAGGRRIAGIISGDWGDISSTGVKKALRNGEPIVPSVSVATEEFIKQCNLYGDSPISTDPACFS